MGDRMTPLSVPDLLRWTGGELRSQGSILGIPASRFYRVRAKGAPSVFGRPCDIPLGPAAGPHTQLAQNLAAAFLAGGRYFELKTVQVLDELEIPKPCIHAGREGYNTEWSTELTVAQALDEYVKGWLLIHFLDMVFFNPDRSGNLLFNMSVGYDLKGIKSPKINEYIDVISGVTPYFRRGRLLQEFHDALEDGPWAATLRDLGISPAEASARLGGVAREVCKSVTLSTMHGCPPAEIEAICRHLLQGMGLDTYVKLNPTLLGFERVRGLLDAAGLKDVIVKRESFLHDLQYSDAVAMVGRLAEFARGLGRRFGVKLSNTLPVANDRGVLPGGEMYMSGRGLYPLTVHLAAELAAHFGGALDVSFSGGADSSTVGDLFLCGVRPVTVATDLLKPGGYLRLGQMARALDEAEATGGAPPEGVVDVARLVRLAEGSTGTGVRRSDRSPKAGLRRLDPLPATDCAVAPCTRNCPASQEVPEYIRLLRDGMAGGALDVVLRRNPLPCVTGAVCDHPCMDACTRHDYEEPVRIRDLKLAVALGGVGRPGSRATTPVGGGRGAAVVGAGPAGLSAAWFLLKGGLAATVFDTRAEAGGTVRHAIPRFRISPEMVESDVSRIREAGASFRTCEEGEVSLDSLRAEGFEHVFLAVGATVSNPLRMVCENPHVYDVMEFLREFNRGGGVTGLGRSVAVVGGGNSAMDGARAAKRAEGVERVCVVYRRTAALMPADREEMDNALSDGVEFLDLLLPVEFRADGTLVCQKMELGEPGADGRPACTPVEGELERLSFDSVISAIGERPDPEFFRRNGLPLDGRGLPVADLDTLETGVPGVWVGGDARRGPASVIEAVADGRRAAESILARAGLGGSAGSDSLYIIDNKVVTNNISLKRGVVVYAQHEPGSGEGAVWEAGRCLECDVVCDKCVDVCPNRANVAVAVGAGGPFRNPHQILHLDALCNECGNCAAFCPWDGEPHKGKFTLYQTPEAFAAGGADGFRVLSPREGDALEIRWKGAAASLAFDRGSGRLAGGGPPAPPGFEPAMALLCSIFEGHAYLPGIPGPSRG